MYSFSLAIIETADKVWRFTMNAEDSMTPMYQGAKMFNKWRTRCGLVLRRNLLVFLTLIGVGVGFIIGFTVAPTKPTASVLLWTGKSSQLQEMRITITAA